MGNKRELVDDGKECERRLGKKRMLVLVDEDEDDGVLDEDSRRRIEELLIINRSYYFDRLPDDIVMSIVDRLSLKDATKTCVLSRRFHHVFKTSLLHRKNLDFEDSARCSKFVQRVNHILHIHEGPKVDSLRIAFDALWTKTMTMCHDFEFKLNKDFKNWLTFARAKSVQSLEIDFRCSIITGSLVSLNYPTFPMFDDWNKLTTLSLKMVHLNDADLEHGLKSRLVNLESMFIQAAFHLKRVVVASPKLKKLEIRNCWYIRSIAIDLAPNLKCFIHEANFDHVVIMNFKVVPKLSHVSLEGRAALSQSSMAELMKVKTLEKLELLGPSRPLHSTTTIFSPRFAMGAWDKLTSLSMKYIKVVDVDIEHLMINLESLYIYDALNLRKLLVKSPKLKWLEIKRCCSIRSIDIDSAPNLEFFCYQGIHTFLGESVVRVSYAPKLSHSSHVSMGESEFQSKRRRNVAKKVYFPQHENIELYYSL